MKLQKHLLLLTTLILVSAVPLLAQVEKAAMRTTGISCGVCAVVAEVNLRGIEGVDKVSISKSSESVEVSYKPGAPFLPTEIRKALESYNVGIAQFQVSAKGRVQQQAGKQFFVAGKDRFVLSSAVNAPKVPLETPVVIEAILNDKLNPMELRVLNFRRQ